MVKVNSFLLTGDYDLVTILETPLSLIKFYNDSKSGVTISYDGQCGHDYCFSGQNSCAYFQPCRSGKNTSLLLRQGTPIYLKGRASRGNIYIVGYGE